MCSSQLPTYFLYIAIFQCLSHVSTSLPSLTAGYAGGSDFTPGWMARNPRMERVSALEIATIASFKGKKELLVDRGHPSLMWFGDIKSVSNNRKTCASCEKLIKFHRFTVAAVVVSASDFETHAPGLTLTETLRFRQEGHLELKCYSVPIKSSSKNMVESGRQPCY